MIWDLVEFLWYSMKKNCNVAFTEICTNQKQLVQMFKSTSLFHSSLSYVKKKNSKFLDFFCLWTDRLQLSVSHTHKHTKYSIKDFPPHITPTGSSSCTQTWILGIQRLTNKPIKCVFLKKLTICDLQRKSFTIVKHLYSLWYLESKDNLIFILFLCVHIEANLGNWKPTEHLCIIFCMQQDPVC